MKINKKNPKHLQALIISGLNCGIVIFLRPLLMRKKAPQKIIIFYGHTLNGNLKAFFDYLHRQEGYAPYFLALDKEYHKRLKETSDKPEAILDSLSIKDMLVVAKASAFISSHGLHFFSLLRTFTSIKFIDVWHAVSYKGFGVKEFNHLHAHDEIWVSSDDMRKLYINRYSFNSKKVKVTGYGRTDILLNSTLNKDNIIAKYDIPKAKKYILIAPTWAQDDVGRNLVPFGLSDGVFFKKLDRLAGSHSAHIIFRTHLNSGDAVSVPDLRHTSFMPYSKYEIAEDFLYIADILVTDWSSIGIDFLPLKRPTIFLDVPAPFHNGFNLGPEHRYGDIATNFQDLSTYLKEYLVKSDSFHHRHISEIQNTTKIAYGDTLDGKSLKRYFKRLRQLL